MDMDVVPLGRFECASRNQRGAKCMSFRIEVVCRGVFWWSLCRRVSCDQGVEKKGSTNQEREAWKIVCAC